MKANSTDSASARPDIEIISASAGSGKTHRLAQLLEDEVASGRVRPSAVLATTFTKKAAAELQERVRVKLIAAGRIEDAQRLTAARIGTVNSVCGQLVGDFAFELGLSPELRVLDAPVAALALHRSLAAVLSPDEVEELDELRERMPQFEWQQTVERIVALARSNGIDAAQLEGFARRSQEEFLTLLGKPGESAEQCDQALIQGLDHFVKHVSKADATIKTQDAVELASNCLRRLKAGYPLPWSDWLKLSRLAPAVANRHAAVKLQAAAAAHDRHPRLHADVGRAIDLVFTLAARALQAYQDHKRELGAIDFVDQEALALRLLERPEVRQRLGEELDLVLVDEFQDTSPLQLAIFLRLASIARRSVWVGDQKQAIYGFRGTDPALMDAAIDQILGGAEPETQTRSYRSRPPLVRLTSAVFAPAFGNQGIPAPRVHLEPARDTEDKELGPCVERWVLDSRNIPGDAAAIAAAVQQTLGDPGVRVRDRVDGKTRPVRPGDVAVVCRTNDQCRSVANELAAVGLRAALPRVGLLATLEGRAVMAGLRLWVDDRDSLAAAELARLVTFAGREDDWLAAVLDRPGAGAFLDLPALVALRVRRQSCPTLGVLGVLDAVLEHLGVADLCRRWGQAAARLANIEALRGHVATYAQSCVNEGAGCTPAGLIAHLTELAGDKEDSQGVSGDDQSVVVSTWHGAKGLEWPIVALYPLTGRESPTAALGLRVLSGSSKIDLARPLDQRWIRFWPCPYHPGNRNAPFHTRLAGHPATAQAMEWERRESLRVLYVGWTRARDRLALVGRAKVLDEGLLDLLCDSKERRLLSEPEGDEVIWAGQAVEIVVRQAAPLAAVARDPEPAVGYDAAGPREHPPAFLQPSGIGGDSKSSFTLERIGSRMAISGDPDWTALGSALHNFLCADRPGLASEQRVELLKGLLDRWGVAHHVDRDDVLQAADTFGQWVNQRWPWAIWHREWPVQQRTACGTIVRGSTDLVLETGEALIVIDHKSFPGSQQQALDRAQSYAGQLGQYAALVTAATGKPVVGVWLHLPISGLVLRLNPIVGGH